MSLGHLITDTGNRGQDGYIVSLSKIVEQACGNDFERELRIATGNRAIQLGIRFIYATAQSNSALINRDRVAFIYFSAPGDPDHGFGMDGDVWCDTLRQGIGGMNIHWVKVRGRWVEGEQTDFFCWRPQELNIRLDALLRITMRGY